LKEKNQSSGSFFVNKWYNEGEKSLEEIQKELQNGNTSWLDRITYFTQKVRGSPQYWRTRRAEVYTWINHHVNIGNGAPNFFITLSCAEYQWEDIKRLIRDRFQTANLEPPDLDRSLVEIINDYTLIVQEYFQKRVDIWLKTVGRNVFKIRHYWLRYEFAPSRGQIHAHILAISDFKEVFEIFHTNSNNKQVQAQFLKRWAETALGYTCDLQDSTMHTSNQVHPSTLYLSAIKNKVHDMNNCLTHLQTHVCSNYCLRHKLSSKCSKQDTTPKKRVCRSGAGEEQTEGKGDTPGFPLKDQPEIVMDARGFLQLDLQRNNSCIIQTSTYALEGKWINFPYQKFYPKYTNNW